MAGSKIFEPLGPKRFKHFEPLVARSPGNSPSSSPGRRRPLSNGGGPAGFPKGYNILYIYYSGGGEEFYMMEMMVKTVSMLNTLQLFLSLSLSLSLSFLPPHTLIDIRK